MPGVATMGCEAPRALAADGDRDPAEGARDDDLAWLTYTSGTRHERLATELDGFRRPRIAGRKRPRRWRVVDEPPERTAGKILEAQPRSRLRDRWESR